jgi:hypothetical protein
MGWSAIRANSAGPISRSATQSGLRTLASGSRDPNARAAAVRIEVREGNPLASIQELSNISGLRARAMNLPEHYDKSHSPLPLCNIAPIATGYTELGVSDASVSAGRAEPTG